MLLKIYKVLTRGSRIYKLSISSKKLNIKKKLNNCNHLYKEKENVLKANNRRSLIHHHLYIGLQHSQSLIISNLSPKYLLKNLFPKQTLTIKKKNNNLLKHLLLRKNNNRLISDIQDKI